MSVETARPSGVRQSRPSRHRAVRLTIVALGTAAVTVTACSSSNSSTSSTSSGGSNGSSSPSTSAGTSTTSVAYTGSESTYPTNYPQPKSCGKVGLQLPTLGNAVSVLQKDTFIKQVKKLGGTPIVLNDNVDPTTQVANFRLLMSQGVKAIGVYPLDPKTLGPVLTDAKSKGIPVIVQELTFGDTVPAGTPPFASQISNSRGLAAYEMMKYIAQKKPGAKVGLIALSVRVPGLDYMFNQQKYWAKKFGLDVVGSQEQGTDDEAGGQQAATSLLARFPNIDAIATYNDLVSLGAAAAARTTGHKIISIGYNGNAEGLIGAKNGQIVDIMLNAPLSAISYANGLCDLSIGVKNLPANVRVELLGPIDQSNASTFKSQDQLAKQYFG